MADLDSAASLDLSGVLSERSGPAGLARQTWTETLSRLAGVGAALEAEHRDAGEHAYLDLDHAAAAADAARTFADETRPRFKRLVQIGIGGSTMGNRALHAALPGDREVRIWDNVDPDGLRPLTEDELDETCFHVVTKSGGTAETLAIFAIVAAQLEQRFGASWTERVSVTTDPERGALRALAEARGLRSFPVPPRLGGRFSVLSSVGLTSLAFSGRDPHALVAGARRAKARGLEDGSAAQAFAAALAGLHDQGARTMILWTYADRLRAFGDWWQQLFAESLGKQRGAESVGTLPVTARGASDQHSILQLLMEGPGGFWVSFVEVEAPEADRAIPALFGEHEAFRRLGGRTLLELLHAERRGTQHALSRAARRPVGLLRVPRLDEGAMGDLLLSSMLTCTYAGRLLGVPPYGQPGVEASKHATWALLGGDAETEAALAPLPGMAFR